MIDGKFEMNGEICDVNDDNNNGFEKYRRQRGMILFKLNHAPVCSVRNMFSITSGGDVVVKYVNNWLVVRYGLSSRWMKVHGRA